MTTVPADAIEVVASDHVVRFDSEVAPGDEGTLEYRVDALGGLTAPSKTVHGFLRTQGYVVKAGVTEYPWGREYTPPDVAFRQDTLDAFSLVPLVLEHPPVGLLSPANVRTYAVGSMGKPTRDGDRAKADLLVTDQQAISAIERGTVQLSPGYQARIVKQAGSVTLPDGTTERFDSVRTLLIPNHMAITTAGRVSGLALRKDSLGDHTMAKIKINDVDFEVPDAVAARLDSLNKAGQDALALAAKNATAADDLAKAQGNIAALENELKTRTDSAAIAAAKSTEDATVTAKLELVARVAPVLGKPIADLVRMDSKNIMREVVAKEAPNTKIEGKPDAFVEGVFEVIMAKRTDSAAALGALVNGAKDNPAGGVKTFEQLNEEARKRAMDKQAKAWQPA